MNPFEAGKDCAINGANTTNCHFSIFSTPERTRQWEAGKEHGLRLKQDAPELLKRMLAGGER